MGKHDEYIFNQGSIFSQSLIKKMTEETLEVRSIKRKQRREREKRERKKEREKKREREKKQELEYFFIIVIEQNRHF